MAHVVGMVADTRYRDFLDPRPTSMFQRSSRILGSGYLLIRTARPFGGWCRLLRQAAREFHPDLDLVNPARRSRRRSTSRWPGPGSTPACCSSSPSSRSRSTAVGLFGLTSFVVVQRRREVGIRRALGAESRQIVALFLRRGMFPVLAGALAGVAIALASGRALASVLYGVTATDPTSIAGAVAGFTLIAVGAILIATRKAARAEPMAVLRE